jgi:hypothetical protein
MNTLNYELTVPVPLNRRRAILRTIQGAKYFVASGFLAMAAFDNLSKPKGPYGLLIHAGERLHVYASSNGPCWDKTEQLGDSSDNSGYLVSNLRRIGMANSEVLSLPVQSTDKGDITSKVIGFLAQNQMPEAYPIDPWELKQLLPPQVHKVSIITGNSDDKTTTGNLGDMVFTETLDDIIRREMAGKIVSFWTDPAASDGLRRMDFSGTGDELPIPHPQAPMQRSTEGLFAEMQGGRPINGARPSAPVMGRREWVSQWAPRQLMSPDKA